MNSLDAVEKVLSDAGEPLHYEEITKRILKQRLWKTEGKTPWATISARLSTDVKKNGAKSRFQRTAPGMYGLRSWGLPERPEKPGAKPKKAKSAPAERLSFTDATERVLDKLGGKQPMHYRDITAKALDLDLVTTAGKTPEATLYAQAITEIQRKKKRGERPRFVMHGKGYVGLSKWMATGLAFQIEQHNQQVRKKLHQQIGKMEWAEFEELIGMLLAKLGFEDVSVTSRSSDGGIDVRGTMVTGDVIGTRMAVQVKRWKKNVQAPTVQQVRGSLGSHEQGLIITTSDFSKGACTEAERPDATPVGLMNGEQLVKLLIENDIGVSRTTYDLIEMGEVDSQ